MNRSIKFSEMLTWCRFATRFYILSFLTQPNILLWIFFRTDFLTKKKQSQIKKQKRDFGKMPKNGRKCKKAPCGVPASPAAVGFSFRLLGLLITEPFPWYSMSLSCFPARLASLSSGLSATCESIMLAMSSFRQRLFNSNSKNQFHQNGAFFAQLLSLPKHAAQAVGI